MKISKHTWLAAIALSLSLPLPALSAPQAMTPEDARHLLSRTGFGAAPHEIDALIGQSADTAVDRILAAINTETATPPPAWVNGWTYPYGQIESLGTTAEEFFYTNRYLEITQLQQWWLGEMIRTPSPMTERLVLFWHGHFATSLEGVEHPQWLAQQNQFFRDHAAGNFRDLAHGILQDPAMLVYLTNTENAAEAPNENLAREYFELFTLGEGRGYTEADVAEAARALTGHTVDYFGGGGHAFDAEMHDFQRKTILGQTGAFDAGDLPDLVMSHPAFGPYIVEALWMEFVSDVPDPAEVARLTDVWRAADWALEPLLRDLLLTDAFWAEDTRGRLVKSPVELLVGAVRSLGLPVPNLAEMAWATEELGQGLFLPPNVGGFPTGRDWLTDATAGLRASVLTYMLEMDPDDAPMGGSGGMMMAGGAALDGEIVVADPDALRVGQAFYLEGFTLEDGEASEMFLTLFDVGFGGYDWRSISLWLEVLPDDTFYLALHRADCAPICFANWPQAEEDATDPDWIEFTPEDGLRRDFQAMDPLDRDLLGAILSNLPALLAGTEGQRAWSAEYLVEEEAFEDEPFALLTPAEAQRAASWLSDVTTSALEETPGALVTGFSRPDPLGLGGLGMGQMMSVDFDAYVEAREEAMLSGAAPEVVYPTADAWLDALPGEGSAQDLARQTLLAVSPPGGGASDRDAEVLIQSLILSPYFQVN